MKLKGDMKNTKNGKEVFIATDAVFKIGKKHAGGR